MTTVEAIPRTRTESRRKGFNMRQYPNAVLTPVNRVFGYAITAAFGLFEGVTFVILWRSGASLNDAVFWFIIAGAFALGVGGLGALDTFIRLHDDYIDLMETYNERIETDYRTPKAKVIDIGHRPITRQDNGSMSIGRHSFSPRQRRQLARLLDVGDNITHETLKQIGMISGDIKAHHNREKANEIQAELIRLGYAAMNGRSKQLTQKGYEELLDHPPTPD